MPIHELSHSIDDSHLLITFFMNDPFTSDPIPMMPIHEWPHSIDDPIH